MSRRIGFLALASLTAAALSNAHAEGATTPGELPKAAPFEHVSCLGAPNEVMVTIKGLDKSVGLVTADLYRNDEDGFLKRSGRVAQVRFAAKAPNTSFCMRAPEAGSYAIAVYHDENANKTFDKRAFGLPAEPYGISNNPVIRFAPPKIDEALFAVAQTGARVEIELKD